MRSLSALALAIALLAGCASDEPEPAADDDTGTVDQTDEQPTEGDVADADAAPDADDDQPDESDNDTTDDAADDSADDEASSTGTVEVEIGDFFFDDDQLAIEVGDTVTWTHRGDITHNVTARDETFVSDNLSSGDTFTHTFDTAGTYDYVCTLHGQMTADIDVT